MTLTQVIEFGVVPPTPEAVARERVRLRGERCSEFIQELFRRVAEVPSQPCSFPLNSFQVYWDDLPIIVEAIKKSGWQCHLRTVNGGAVTYICIAEPGQEFPKYMLS